MEMVSCGKCKGCLAGGRVHGPYPYYYTRDANGVRHHRYGSPGVGSAVVDPEVKARMRAEARDEAERLDAALSDEARAKRDAAMAHVRDQARLRRKQDKRMNAAIREAQARGDSPSAIMRMTDEIEAADKAERDVLQARFAAAREELETMLFQNL